MTLGERIKKARTARGLTQEKLGELCGTTKQAIFKYEAGIVTNIPTDRLERIAEVLNTTPAELMGWADTLPLPDNVVPYVPAGRVPLVGDIACGEPILAEQNIVDYAAQRSNAARCAASEYPSRAWSSVDTRMYIATRMLSPP